MDVSHRVQPQQFSQASDKVHQYSEYKQAANLWASSAYFIVYGLDPGRSYAGELFPHKAKGAGRPTH